MADFSQRFRLDLTDALPGDLEFLTDLLEGAGPAVLQSEPELQNLFLARAQGVEHLVELFAQELIGRRFLRGGVVVVRDEIAEVAVVRFADGGFERDGILGDFHDLAHLLGRHADVRRDLLRRRFPAVLLKQLALAAGDLVDRFDHVHGDADRSRLIRDGAADRLTDPPRRVGREFIALRIIEFLRRLHQAEVALLDQIEEEHALADVPLRDADDQTEVRFHQLVFRRGVALAHAHREFGLALRREQGDGADLL